MKNKFKYVCQSCGDGECLTNDPEQAGCVAKDVIGKEIAVWKRIGAKTLWKSGEWEIQETENNDIEVADGWKCYYPTQYDNGKVAYDYPERIPKKVREQVKKIFDNKEKDWLLQTVCSIHEQFEKGLK